MKRILFFTYDFPYPTNSGGKSRAYNLIKFACTGFDVTLFSFIRSGFKTEYEAEIKKIGVNTIEVFKRKSVKSLKSLSSVATPKSSIFKGLYYNSEVEKKLIEIIEKEKIEIVVYESMYTSYYISETLKNMGVKQIYGTENIEYKNYEEYIEKILPFIRLPFQFQVKKIKNEEAEFAKKADVTLAVTQDEGSYFKNAGAERIEIIPNGVDLDEFQFRPSKRLHGDKILFVGNFSYFPNRDGISFFYNEVFKKLPKQYHLTIIGKNSEKLGIKDENITLIDYVNDIREAYYKADVLISPIRIGGGTNFKVLEAMACGLPVLAHDARMKSFGFTADEELLTASTGEEFAQKLEMLLNNDALQGKLAKNAREFIEKNYSWQVIGKKLNSIFKEI